MIKHLRVSKSKAQEAKIFLKESNALNESFLPIKEEEHILWPLNFEVDGEIILCEGKKSTRESRDYRLRLPVKIQSIVPRAFDIFGDIAIIKLSEESRPYSELICSALLESHGNINKVALDMGVKGDYRIRNLEMLFGDLDFVSTHRENGFEFTLDISQVYFSPRLSLERKRVYDITKSEEEVLDAFAGAAPFSVALASKGCKLTSVDPNPAAELWSHKNFKLNNIAKTNYEFINSRIEDIVSELPFYDRIIMNHPTKSLNYLEMLSEKMNPKGTLHLYKIVEKNDDFHVNDYLTSDFECIFEREVHAYSPQSSLKVFDITKSDSNVQKTNQ